MQRTQPLTGGSTLKFTTAHYIFPNGFVVDGVGLDPDVEVADSHEQLQTALDMIRARVSLVAQ